jgi:hypothetical protein
MRERKRKGRGEGGENKKGRRKGWVEEGVRNRKQINIKNN